MHSCLLFVLTGVKFLPKSRLHSGVQSGKFYWMYFVKRKADAKTTFIGLYTSYVCGQ